mgnify:CR=1 FL=1
MTPTESNKLQGCTGIMINWYTIVTAAHCVSVPAGTTEWVALSAAYLQPATGEETQAAVVRLLATTPEVAAKLLEAVKYFANATVPQVAQQFAAARHRDPDHGLDLSMKNMENSSDFFRKVAGQ